MALFKTFRGKRENLDTVALTDGYAYFCTDDGSFWIDYKDGEEIIRKQVNDADIIRNVKDGEGLDSIVQKYTAQEDDVEGEDFANTATGPNTVTFGKSNTNSGKRSVVTGKLNDNTGANNIIGGLLNEASGNSCIIGGQNNQSSARDTLVVGSENRNFGPNSAITGFNNENNSESNLIAGRDNTNYFSNQNLIVGSNNWADQDAAHPAGNSIIGGENNHVFGLDTIVGGSNNTANSKHNLIVGFGNKVTQNDNATFGNHIVSGEQNEVTGLDNTVNGFDNTVSGDYNTVGGYQHTVSGGKNAVSGHNNTVSGSNSVAGGAGVTVNGTGALGVASGGSVTGTGAWIGGKNCTVTKQMAFAHGENLISNYNWQKIFGRFNDNKSDTLFEIGNGDGEDVKDSNGNITTKNRKNAFAVLKDGRAKVQTAPKENDDVIRLTDITDGSKEVNFNKIAATNDINIGDGKTNPSLIFTQPGNSSINTEVGIHRSGDWSKKNNVTGLIVENPAGKTNVCLSSDFVSARKGNELQWDEYKDSTYVATLKHLNDAIGSVNATIEEVKAEGINQVSTTWAELKELRDNAQLIPGAFYRITDYVCTTSQERTRAMDHRFDIIVQALSECTLSENASADYHDGDSYFATFESGIVSSDITEDRIGGIDLADGDVEWVYSIYEDYDNGDYSEPMPPEHKGDYFVQFDFDYNNNDVLVPVLYKTDESYADEGPDYGDAFYYVGEYELDGIIYDRWRKIEGDVDADFNWDSTAKIYALTNKIVGEGLLIEASFVYGKGLIEKKANLQAWQLKYCLDNDKERFEWAAAEGRGIIYWMKDEWNNECPYDFKNIQYQRNEYTEDYNWYYTFSLISEEGAESQDITMQQDRVDEDGLRLVNSENVIEICRDATSALELPFNIFSIRPYSYQIGAIYCSSNHIGENSTYNFIYSEEYLCRVSLQNYVHFVTITPDDSDGLHDIMVMSGVVHKTLKPSDMDMSTSVTYEAAGAKHIILD
jgi:hypothetical protein